MSRTRAVAAVVLACLMVASMATVGVSDATAQSAEFEGGITLSGSPAASGQTFEYSLDSTDKVTDPEVTFTGVKNTANRSVSAQGSDETVTVDPRGTSDPEQAVMTIEGVNRSEPQSISQTKTGGTFPVDVGGSVSTTADVTFTGHSTSTTDSIAKTGATDGDSIAYDIGGNQPPEDATVSITGRSTSASDSVTRSVGPGGGFSWSVGGNKDTTVDATLTGTRGAKTHNAFNNEGDGGEADTIDTFAGTSAGSPINSEIATTSSYTGSMEQIRLGYHTAQTGGYTADIYIAKEGPDGDYTDGTLVKSNYDLPSSTGWDTIPLDTYYNVDAGATYQIQFVTDGSSGSGDYDGWKVYVDTSGGSIQTTEGDKTAIPQMTYSQAGTTDPSVDIDGDGSADISASGELGTGSVSDTVSLSPGSYSASYSATAGGSSVSLSWTETSQTKDPSVTIDGSTVSHTGFLGDGQTVTETVSLSRGSGSATVSTQHKADVSASWTETTATENPSVTVDGNTASYNGVLAQGETATDTIPLTPGSYTASVSTGHKTDIDMAWDDEYRTDNPQFDLAGTSVFNSGRLAGGQTVTKTVSLQTGQSYTGTVTSDGPVKASVEWVDVSRPVDPTVSVNGEPVQHTGTLADGQTTSVVVPKGYVQVGTNTVQVDAGDANGGPTPLVGFDYGHDAGASEKNVSVTAETWSERFSANQTYASDQQNTTVRLTFSENIVNVRDLTVKVNGATQAIEPSDGTWDPETPALEVPVGDRLKGDTVEVSVVGEKVGVQNGEVTIDTPTPEGEQMDTEFTTYPDGSGVFGIDVSGTVWSDRLHTFESVSWQDDETYTEVRTERQILKMPNAQTGSKARVGVTDMRIDPTGGPVKADPKGGVGTEGDDDFAYQRVELNFTGAAEVDVVYRDTVSGEVYGLERRSDGVVVDKAQAKSPVTLTAVDSGTYAIIPSQFEAAITMGPTSGSGGGGVLPGPTWLWLLIGLGGATAITIDLVAPGGRFSSGVPGRLWSAITSVVSLIPGVNVGETRSRSRFAGRGASGATSPDRRTTLVAIAGLAVIGVIAAELVTARSIFFDLPGILLSGVTTGVTDAIAGSAFAPIAIGTVAVLALWGFDQLTDTALPRWVQIIGVGSVVVYMVESIRPGTLLGPVSEAISTTLPLLILGGLFVLWRWNRSRGGSGS